MNWLDFILIVILAIGLVVGLRIGILGAIYCTVVVFLAWLAAAQLGSLVGKFFELFLDDDRIVTVVSFTAIMAVVVYIGGKLWTPIRTALGIGTLGASNVIDRVGGIAVGLVLGIVVSGALLVGLMRLSNTDDATFESVRDDLEAALVESTFMPLFVQGVDSLPADTLGLLPGDFRTSYEIVRDHIR